MNPLSRRVAAVAFGLALASPLHAQNDGPHAGGIGTTSGGLSNGAADKAPTATPRPSSQSAGDSDACPPSAPTAPVDATPGWLGDLAFDSKRNRWLVVSHAGQIHGRLMANTGQPAGAVFTVSGAGHSQSWAPMAAYSPEGDKYLVVYVDYSKGGNDLHGRFVSGDGQPGASFPISFAGAPGGPMLNLGGERTSALRYDAATRRFVLVVDARAARDHAILTTIDLEGKRGPLVEVGSAAGGGNWAPSVAVGPGEYCVGFDQRNSPRWAVARVSASGLAAGAETTSAQTTTNVDIAYNAKTGKYVAIYDAGYAVGVRARVLNSCNVNDSAGDVLLLPKEGYSSVAANPKGNSFAAIGQNHSDSGNGYAVSAGGAAPTRGVLFTGGEGNYLPVIKANTVDGTYAAISSRDYKTTRFVARIGCGGGVSVPAPSDELLTWITPQHNGSGSGQIPLAGTVAPSIKKVEILVNLKKVGDATITAGSWWYALDATSYSGGINLSALATDDKGKASRFTIRFNLR